MVGVRRWATQAVGGLPRAFWLLWAATLVNRIGGFIIIYLSIYLLVVRDFTPSFVGLVVGMYGAGMAVGGMAGGVFSDRWGPRTTIVVANLAASGVAVTLGLVTGGTTITALAALLGCLTNITRPASAAMIADLVPEADRLRAFSLNFWAVNLGYSGAALLGGALAGLDYTLLFLLDAATTLIAAAMVWRLPRRRTTDPETSSGSSGT
ncbi:MAG TPA: MFS transporter, partial [Micromonosporaceae bacterium]|nr:MFS transporter [Micromonosporaceae bacterium]